MRTLQLNGTSLQSGCSQVTAREDGMLLDANVWVTLMELKEQSEQKTSKSTKKVQNQDSINYMFYV